VYPKSSSAKDLPTTTFYVTGFYDEKIQYNCLWEPKSGTGKPYTTPGQLVGHLDVQCYGPDLSKGNDPAFGAGTTYVVSLSSSKGKMARPEVEVKISGSYNSGNRLGSPFCVVMVLLFIALLF
jgi:hypothetical protein